MAFLEPTAALMPTGLYEYDLGAQRAVEAAQARRQAGLSAPVIGAGGLQGAGLLRRQGIEESFQAAVQEAERRRLMQEIRRRSQEAELGKRRRAQTMQAGAGAIGNVTTGLIAGLSEHIPAKATTGTSAPANAAAQDATSTATDAASQAVRGFRWL